MNIDDMKYGELKKIAAMFSSVPVSHVSNEKTLNCMIGEKCIIRTYSAGVWFGEIEQKSGSEVIIKNARRMWRWHAAESISLSAVANHGIKEKQSKIAEPVASVWLEAVELIPCSAKSINSIEGAEDAKAE